MLGITFALPSLTQVSDDFPHIHLLPRAFSFNFGFSSTPTFNFGFYRLTAAS
jgi:hypothetical protein